VVKPGVSSVHRVLREHRAIVVHFSSVPQMENIKSYFPDSLRSVIANQIPGGLCCSTVVPGDTHQNALGSTATIPPPCRCVCVPTLAAISNLVCHRPLSTRLLAMVGCMRSSMTASAYWRAATTTACGFTRATDITSPIDQR
jgi:hypothetical protein